MTSGRQRRGRCACAPAPPRSRRARSARRRPPGPGRAVRPSASPLRTVDGVPEVVARSSWPETGGRPTALVRAVATSAGQRDSTTARSSEAGDRRRGPPVGDAAGTASVAAGSVVDVRATRSRGPSNRSAGATTSDRDQHQQQGEHERLDERGGLAAPGQVGVDPGGDGAETGRVSPSPAGSRRSSGSARRRAPPRWRGRAAATGRVIVRSTVSRTGAGRPGRPVQSRFGAGGQPHRDDQVGDGYRVHSEHHRHTDRALDALPGDNRATSSVNPARP